MKLLCYIILISLTSIASATQTLIKPKELKTNLVLKVGNETSLVNVLINEQKSISDEIFLHIQIDETKTRSKKCTYYVKDFEIIPSSINLIFDKDFCLNENLGQSKGNIYWAISKSKFIQNRILQLNLNQHAIGCAQLNESTGELFFPSCKIKSKILPGDSKI